MKMKEEVYDKIKQDIKNYDISNPTMPDNLRCPLFPNVDINKLSKLIGFVPHPLQSHILANMSRFTVVNAWRQIWKSDVAAFLLILSMMVKKNWEYMVVSVDHPATLIIIDKLLAMTFDHRKDFHFQKKDWILTFKPTNSKVYLKTWQNPNSLVWKTLDWLIVDEAVYLDDTIWSQKLSATVAVKKWWVLFTSTPLWENDFFYSLFKKWQLEPGEVWFDPAYVSFHFTSYDSPYQDPTFLEQMKESLAHSIYEQQYLAKPLSDAWEVFVNIKKNATVKWDWVVSKWKYRYMIWWDLAKLTDFSVWTVLDRKTNEVIQIERMNWVDWIEQIGFTLDLSEKFWCAPIFMDATVKWEPILEFLKDAARARKMPVYVEWIEWTSTTKNPMVRNLIIALEKWELTYIPDPMLLKEMEDYRCKITENGNVKYLAKKHSTDDIISSLICLWEWVKRMWPFRDVAANEYKSWRLTNVRRWYKSIY